MSEENRNVCTNIIKFQNGSGLKTKIGIVAGGIYRKNSVYYCPECVKIENEKYKETYIHRLHQVEGVFICERHKCMLKSYKDTSKGRLSYVYLDTNNIDDNIEFFDINTEKKLYKIACEVKYLLDHELSRYLDLEKVIEKYQYILEERGYLSAKKSIRKVKLIHDFNEFHGKVFLHLMES